MTSVQIDTTATLGALEADNNRLKGQIKMKEELIPGMEKMIAYLHKIQEENKELKTSLQTTTSYHTDRYALLGDENKKLKEENKGLQLTQLLTLKVLQDKEKDLELLQDQLEDDDDDKICDLLECDHDGRYDAIRELKDEYDGWKASYDDDMREKQEEINELQRQIDMMKETEYHLGFTDK